jgi:hypothetical protein
VSFLFTNVQGSTRLWTADKEAMSASLLVHDSMGGSRRRSPRTRRRARRRVGSVGRCGCRSSTRCARHAVGLRHRCHPSPRRDAAAAQRRAVVPHFVVRDRGRPSGSRQPGWAAPLPRRGSFAHHVVEMRRSSHRVWLQNAFAVIERMHTDGDAYVAECCRRPARP